MTAPEIVEDPREAAFDVALEWGELLRGDVVLMPFRQGKPDWEHCTRQSLAFVGDHWTEIGQADIPRLAILTDGFNRFVPGGRGVAVVTHLRSGTPEVRQIEGMPSAGALDSVMRAIVDREPIRELRHDIQAANDNAAPDHSLMERLERLQREHGGEIQSRRGGVGPTLIGATFGDISGQVFVDEDGRFRLWHSKGSVEVVETPRLAATPLTLRDPSTLPLRDWLYGKHYIRRYATASVGQGGGGKTAHSISEALAMVTGRPLLDPQAGLSKPLRVWWVNAEDPQDEIERRFAAAAKHFNVTNDQIGGRLFADSGRDQEFVIVKQAGRELKVCEPFVADIVAEIKRREVDVLIVDPFVSTHEAPENDNTAMQRVAAAWVRVADEANCGVELVHHVSKGVGEITADSARGGGAFKDKTRSMRVFNVMTKEEALKAGLPDHRGYFRVDFGKVNMVASGRSQWRRFVNVPLGNGKGLLKTGDEIGVVEPWSWPDPEAVAERAAEDRRAVVADVPAELLAGLKVRLENADHKASDQARNWAGIVVAELMGLDITDKEERVRVRRMLECWTDMGELQVVDLPDHRRHLSPHIKPCAT